MVFSTDQALQVASDRAFIPWNTAEDMNTGLAEAAPKDPESWSFIFGAWRGRVSRRTFWLYGVAALLGLSVLGQALLEIAGVRGERSSWIVEVLLVYPALAVSAKRWQDRGRSPWWVLVVLIPVFGWLWALVDNGFVRGTGGPNRFGPEPIDVQRRRLPTI
jgi:uncharacterized membrane protein YhaH (DUF805 family)